VALMVNSSVRSFVLCGFVGLFVVVVVVCLFVFETGFLCVVLAVLELTL